jgi:ABC-type nickel/cobalt efflux system permease component RcnA
MGEFYAWALTGQVTRLQLLPNLDDRRDDDDREEDDPSWRVSSDLPPRQLFRLRPSGGMDVEVQLVDSGVALQNSHTVTVAWAAREGAGHGFCVFVSNHTTGASARLEANVRQLRSRVKASTIVPFGILAALPAALAILAWLTSPGSITGLDTSILLLAASIAIVVLFALGAIVAKVAADYMHSEDDEKIWAAVDAAIAEGNKRQRKRNSRLLYGS